MSKLDRIKKEISNTEAILAKAKSYSKDLQDVVLIKDYQGVLARLNKMLLAFA